MGVWTALQVSLLIALRVAYEYAAGIHRGAGSDESRESIMIHHAHAQAGSYHRQAGSTSWGGEGPRCL
jgi:hypothetical protein